MANNAQFLCIRHADDEKSLLPDRVIGIIEENRIIIIENRLCFFKGHAMFFLIGEVLGFIPCDVHIYNYIIHIFYRPSIKESLINSALP